MNEKESKHEKICMRAKNLSKKRVRERVRNRDTARNSPYSLGWRAVVHHVRLGLLNAAFAVLLYQDVLQNTASGSGTPVMKVFLVINTIT